MEDDSYTLSALIRDGTEAGSVSKLMLFEAGPAAGLAIQLRVTLIENIRWLYQRHPQPR
jgi:hypothetical protein